MGRISGTLSFSYHISGSIAVRKTRSQFRTMASSSSIALLVTAGFIRALLKWGRLMALIIGLCLIFGYLDMSTRSLWI